MPENRPWETMPPLHNPPWEVKLQMPFREVNRILGEILKTDIPVAGTFFKYDALSSESALYEIEASPMQRIGMIMLRGERGGTAIATTPFEPIASERQQQVAYIGARSVIGVVAEVYKSGQITVEESQIARKRISAAFFLPGSAVPDLEMDRNLREPPPVEDDKPQREERTPQRRDRTREQDTVIKQMKDAHPDWSYTRLVRGLMEEENLEVTEDQIRAAYKRNGWTWRAPIVSGEIGVVISKIPLVITTYHPDHYAMVHNEAGAASHRKHRPR